MNDNLNKYILEGQVMEDLMKRQDESFVVLTESGEETKKTVPVNYYPNDIRRFLVESIMAECSPYSPGIAGLPGCRPGENSDPKIEKTRALLSVVQDMVWKMNASAYADPDVCKAVQDACGPLIKTMVQKLYNIWCIDDADKNAAVAPQPAKEVSTTADPAGADALPATAAPVEPTGLELTFVQGESITSPQNKEYIIEAVGAAQLRLKEKKTGVKATVSIEIAKKWKK